MEHIHRIGLEIEGGWFSDKRPSNIKHDGSVQFKRREYKIRGETNKLRVIQLGEVASSPLPSIEDGKKWIEQYWPDKRNETCGFHIHLSFKDKLRYSYLMDAEFYDLFLKSAFDFGHKERMSKEFFKRLEGKNRYCKKMFVPEKQIDFQHNHNYTDSNPRYAHLNYCFSTHGTMENRLPTGAMTKGKAVKTLEWYLDLVESYLDRKMIGEKPFVFEIEKVEEKVEKISLTNNNPVLL